MNRKMFVAFGMLLLIVTPSLVAQGASGTAYPTVDSWLREKKIVLAEEASKAALEKAILNNIRGVFIQNGISAETYKGILDEVILEFYRKTPRPSDARTNDLLGNRGYLLKYLTLKGYKGRVLIKENLPTVSRWLKDHQVELHGSWEEAHWELALLHNIRLVCLVYDYPEETYLTLLEEVILPILKSGEPGLTRGVALKNAREMLFLTLEPNGTVAQKKK